MRSNRECRWSPRAGAFSARSITWKTATSSSREKTAPTASTHFIPIQWVARVGDRIDLNQDAAEARHNWKSDVAFA